MDGSNITQDEWVVQEFRRKLAETRKAAKNYPEQRTFEAMSQTRFPGDDLIETRIVLVRKKESDQWTD
jgi:hypothetical protein